MESGNLAPGEHLVQCPYNVSHMILSKKQITHLDKCRRQYEKDEKAKGRSPEIVACRYNFSHRVIKPEIRLHEEQCPDQYAIIHSIAQSQELKPDPFLGATTVVKKNEGAGVTSNVDVSEDWDMDGREQKDGTSASGGYDPTVKLSQGPFLYAERGLTKSERKAARDRNRIKWLEAKEAKAKAEAELAAPLPRKNYDILDEDDWIPPD